MLPARRISRVATLFVLLIVAGFAQTDDPAEVKLPNGKSWPNAIAKADHEKNLKDASDLVLLATEIQTEIEKSDNFVLPLKTIKKIETMEKLSKTLRVRMQRN
ncbi:MAG: hypothetical protein ABI824_11545 [Acidobacteriota bacterium]